MTFKDFLKEFVDAEMTPAEFARAKRQAEMNPRAAAMKNAKKQDLEARAAAEDDSKSPEEKKAEKLDAMAARERMRVAQQKKQNEAQ